MQTNSSGTVAVGPRPRTRKPRRVSTGFIVWGGLLRIVQRLTHYKKSDLREFKLGFSVRDLLTDKRRVVKDQFDALVQAVQKAGSYQAKDEAARAVHAVMDVLKDRVPPEVLITLSESLPVREAAKLRRAATQRLQREGDPSQPSPEPSGETGGPEA